MKLSKFKKSKNEEERGQKIRTSQFYFNALMEILKDENFASKESEIEQILDDLIKTRNGKYILDAGRELNGLFVSKIEDALINLEEPLFLYSFAIKVKGANISRIEDEIIKSEDCYMFTKFVENVKTANVKKFEDALINMGDYHLIAYFANNASKANISRMEDALIKKGDIPCICGFARLVKRVNIQKLEDAIIGFGKSGYMVTFAKDVKDCNRERLEKAVIRAENSTSSLRWLNAFPTDYFDEHLEIVVDNGTFGQCYSIYNQFYDCLSPTKKELLMFALNSKAQSSFELVQLANIKNDGINK